MAYELDAGNARQEHGRTLGSQLAMEQARLAMVLVATINQSEYDIRINKYSHTANGLYNTDGKRALLVGPKSNGSNGNVGNTGCRRSYSSQSWLDHFRIVASFSR